MDKVCKRVVRNPHKSMRNLSKDLNISNTSTRRLVMVAGFKSMMRLVVHYIMPGQEAKRKERAELLLR